MKKIRLDSKNLTLCFSLDGNQPEYLYFGKKLGKNATFARYLDKETNYFGVDLHRPIFSTFGSYEHHVYRSVWSTSDAIASISSGWTGMAPIRTAPRAPSPCLPLRPGLPHSAADSCREAHSSVHECSLAQIKGA